MAHVTVYYKMLVREGRHRQPRSSVVELVLAPVAGGDVPEHGSFTPAFFPELPYILGTSSGQAKILFWQVAEGTTGKVLPPIAFTQPVHTDNITITAWYYQPPFGGGPGGGPAIMVDAFSAVLGRFIDDTFMTVTGSPALTNDANVIGLVSTATAVNFVATTPAPSTAEPFSKWVLDGVMQPAGTAGLAVSANDNGAAIAVYQQPNIPHCGRHIICGVNIHCGVAISCRRALSPCLPALACAAFVGGGCPAIDPVPDDWRGWEEMFRVVGVKSIQELAAKRETAQVKKAMAKYSPAQRKAIDLMLKQIANA